LTFGANSFCARFALFLTASALAREQGNTLYFARAESAGGQGRGPQASLRGHPKPASKKARDIDSDNGPYTAVIAVSQTIERPTAQFTPLHQLPAAPRLVRLKRGLPQAILVLDAEGHTVANLGRAPERLNASHEGNARSLCERSRVLRGAAKPFGAAP
jgi:hypothetical protein